MYIDAVFDKEKDLQAVVPGLSIDLTKAIETHTVIDTGTGVDYNGIEEPADIVGVVRDPFEAIDAQSAVLKRGKKSSSAPAPAPAQGVSNPESGKTE